MRPPITYYGGKQKMLKYILPLIPKHEIYCEAFMGGGAVFFAKEPSKAEIINDINGNVSNFYRVVQSDFESLKKLIDGTLHSRGTYKEALAIYKNHAINVVNNNTTLNTSKENPLCGWAFWVLTNDGFSGKIGSWAMERKSNKTGKTLANKRENFCKEYAKRLDKVSVENRDALEIIKQYDSPETFFYLDPPYFNSDCGHYKDYKEADYTKLLEVLTTIKGKFLLSSYPSEILNQYVAKQNWHRNEIKQKTRVTHRSKKIKTEVLVWNYDVESGTAALLEQRTEEKNSLSEAEGVHYFSERCKQNLPIVIKESGTKRLRHPKRVSCFAAKPKFITMQNKEALILENCYRSMLRGISSYKSKIAQQYLSEKKLSHEKTFAGFSSGQIHHRKEQTLIDELLSVGFLKPSKAPTNNSKIGYSSFGSCSIIFPLRNEENSIVNFYSIGIKKPQSGYLNEIGIYPSYPPASTKKLFLVNSILDAATLLEADLLNKGEAVMALREGKLTAEHLTAISALHELQESIELKEDLNTLFQREGKEGIINAINSLKLQVENKGSDTKIENVALPPPPQSSKFPFENKVVEPQNWNRKAEDFLRDTGGAASISTDLESTKKVEDSDTQVEKGTMSLKVLHENKLAYESKYNRYYVLGQLSQDISSMRITLMVEELIHGRKERSKIDLYERAAVNSLSLELSELFHQEAQTIENDLTVLTDLLEKYREEQNLQERPAYKGERYYQNISSEQKKECIAFLSKENLMKNLDELIECTGVVGEESTRKLVFVIASTYKMSTPLHSLLQGSSASGKSHLINAIGSCFPPEDVISMTRVTSKSFYHYNKEELVDKLILIQDYDGLDEEAQYAFRELQSAGTISSSTTYKDKYGNLVSGVKTVKSHFASLLATTKAEVYYDNMSRSLVLGMDECEAQTQNIISYQNKKIAGQIDENKEHASRLFLQNCMRCISPMEVVNPYADKIQLPIEAKMLRRLNSHYHCFVKQITLLHQYQREKDNQGRLIVTPEDLQIACSILLDAIVIKVDDLDSSLRQFFDKMKNYVQLKTQTKNQEPHKNKMNTEFTQREIRLALNSSKTQCFRYMEDLEQLEYIQKIGGYSNKGFKYKIVYWDDMKKIKEKIKAELAAQLAAAA